MLEEQQNVSQKEEGIHRRWFNDNYFELITWEKSGAIIGFQLCYDRFGSEKSLTWKKDKGFYHDTVDSGEVSMGTDMSAILIEDGPVPVDMLVQRFTEESQRIDNTIREFILDKFTTIKKSPS
jgi:hypothetical protein